MLKFRVSFLSSICSFVFILFSEFTFAADTSGNFVRHPEGTYSSKTFKVGVKVSTPLTNGYWVVFKLNNNGEELQLKSTDQGNVLWFKTEFPAGTLVSISVSASVVKMFIRVSEMKIIDAPLIFTASVSQALFVGVKLNFPLLLNEKLVLKNEGNQVSDTLLFELNNGSNPQFFKAIKYQGDTVNKPSVLPLNSGRKFFLTPDRRVLSESRELFEAYLPKDSFQIGITLTRVSGDMYAHQFRMKRNGTLLTVNPADKLNWFNGWFRKGDTIEIEQLDASNKYVTENPVYVVGNSDLVITLKSAVAHGVGVHFGFTPFPGEIFQFGTPDNSNAILSVLTAPDGNSGFFQKPYYRGDHVSKPFQITGGSGRKVVITPGDQIMQDNDIRYEVTLPKDSVQVGIKLIRESGDAGIHKFRIRNYANVVTVKPGDFLLWFDRSFKTGDTIRLEQLDASNKYVTENPVYVVGNSDLVITLKSAVAHGVGVHFGFSPYPGEIFQFGTPDNSRAILSVLSAADGNGGFFQLPYYRGDHVSKPFQITGGSGRKVVITPGDQIMQDNDIRYEVNLPKDSVQVGIKLIRESGDAGIHKFRIRNYGNVVTVNSGDYLLWFDRFFKAGDTIRLEQLDASNKYVTENPVYVVGNADLVITLKSAAAHGVGVHFGFTPFPGEIFQFGTPDNSNAILSVLTAPDGNSGFFQKPYYRGDHVSKPFQIMGGSGRKVVITPGDQIMQDNDIRYEVNLPKDSVQVGIKLIRESGDVGIHKFRIRKTGEEVEFSNAGTIMKWFPGCYRRGDTIAIDCMSNGTQYATTSPFYILQNADLMVEARSSGPKRAGLRLKFKLFPDEKMEFAMPTRSLTVDLIQFMPHDDTSTKFFSIDYKKGDTVLKPFSSNSRRWRRTLMSPASLIMQEKDLVFEAAMPKDSFQVGVNLKRSTSETATIGIREQKTGAYVEYNVFENGMKWFDHWFRSGDTVRFSQVLGYPNYTTILPYYIIKDKDLLLDATVQDQNRVGIHLGFKLLPQELLQFENGNSPVDQIEVAAGMNTDTFYFRNRFKTGDSIRQPQQFNDYSRHVLISPGDQIIGNKDLIYELRLPKDSFQVAVALTNPPGSESATFRIGRTGDMVIVNNNLHPTWFSHWFRKGDSLVIRQEFGNTRYVAAPNTPNVINSDLVVTMSPVNVHVVSLKLMEAIPAGSRFEFRLNEQQPSIRIQSSDIGKLNVFQGGLKNGDPVVIRQISGPSVLQIDPYPSVMGDSDLVIKVRPANVQSPATSLWLAGTVIAHPGSRLEISSGLNEKQWIEIPASGKKGFHFPNKYRAGDPYSIQVTSAPTGCHCVVVPAAAGTMPVDSSGINIFCSPDVELATTDSTGKVQNSYFESFQPVIGGTGPDEGRYIAFLSYGSGLDGNSGKYRQLFRKDMLTGRIVMVSRSGSGEEGNGNSLSPVISSDGHTIAFESYASNLVPDDVNRSTRDVFVWNDRSGLKLVSRNTGGSGNAESFEPAISGNGNVITFSSYASDLTPGVDGTSILNVFMADSTGTLRLLSRDIKTGKGAGGSASHISDDGTRVVFCSFSGSLTGNDNNNLWDIFLWQKGQPGLKRISMTANGAERTQGDESSSRVVNASISGNGRFIVYSTTADNMTGQDKNKMQDVFLYDTENAAVKRMSETAEGTDANGDSPLEQGGRIGISYTGEWICYVSNASNLGAPAGNILLQNTRTGKIIPITSSTMGTRSRPLISQNGIYLVAGSSELLDPRFSSSGQYRFFTGPLLNNAGTKK